MLAAAIKGNCKNRSGRTALHIAASKGNLDLVKLLIQFGANKTAKDNLGMTPYDFAANSDIRQAMDSPSPMPVHHSTAPQQTGEQSAVLFCSNCGIKVESATAKFCSGCGNKLK